MKTTPNTPPARALLRKWDDSRKKTIRAKANTPQAQYARSAATGADWTILPQDKATLPAALINLISLNSRDTGHELIERTRELNNFFTGRSMKRLTALSSCDLEIAELRSRIMDWALKVAEEVSYKLRYRASKNPVETHKWFVDAIAIPLEQTVSFRRESMYALAWMAVGYILHVRMFEKFFFEPERALLKFDLARRACLTSGLREAEHSYLLDQLSLHAVEPAAYTLELVLRPLLSAIKGQGAGTAVDLKAEYEGMVADLLEAFPYLLGSSRQGRYVFEMPDKQVHCAFVFLPKDGAAQFLFWDSEADLIKGLATNTCRGGLTLGWDGQLSLLLHPWRKLALSFAIEDVTLLQHWLVAQVHERVVGDYLKIERYFLSAHPVQVEIDCPDENPFVETAGYMNLVHSAALEEQHEDEDSSCPNEARPRVRIPQLRMSNLFSILARCGVQIEHGKGSEMKLIRKGSRPFLLGSHYGPNPRIPTILAVNILRRLGISEDEWLVAYRGCA